MLQGLVRLEGLASRSTTSLALLTVVNWNLLFEVHLDGSALERLEGFGVAVSAEWLAISRLRFKLLA